MGVKVNKWVANLDLDNMLVVAEQRNFAASMVSMMKQSFITVGNKRDAILAAVDFANKLVLNTSLGTNFELPLQWKYAISNSLCVSNKNKLTTKPHFSAAARIIGGEAATDEAFRILERTRALYKDYIEDIEEWNKILEAQDNLLKELSTNDASHD